jgi:ABC-type Fe3+/spermidine/putrescine transport system ATPase subunit
MVTHDQEEAMTMATRIALMDQGRIRQVGTPDEIYEQPTSRFAAEFIGSVNLFEGNIEEDEADYVTIRSPQLPDADLRRPRHLRLRRPGGRLRACARRSWASARTSPSSPQQGARA